MAKEVEVKARVRDMGALVAKLEDMGCAISDPVVQKDVIFVDDNYGKFGEFQPGKNVLRIREAKDKFIFTLKQPQKNDLDCIEHETEISDPGELRASIELMGFKEVARVNKIRRKAKYNGDEICLDEVEGLGSFVEVERLSEGDHGEKVQEELFDFLLSLGIKEGDRVTRGYDILIYHKNTQN